LTIFDASSAVTQDFGRAAQAGVTIAASAKTKNPREQSEDIQQPFRGIAKQDSHSLDSGK
jgi:hypothetical protein